MTSTAAGGGAVDAEAVFTIDQTAGSLTLQLINLLTGEVGSNQSISGVKFSMTTGTATLSGGTGDMGKIAPNGTFTDQGTGSLNLWNASTSLGVTTLADGSASQSKQLILGPSNNGVYTGANPTIDGKGTNPWVNQIAAFTFTGVTGLVDVTSVQIGFGTALNNYIAVPTADAQVTSTPEPAGWLLLSGGLGLIAVRRRKQRHSC